LISAGDHHPALLATGHIPGIGVGAIAQTHSVEQIVRPRIGRRGIHRAAKQGWNRDVVDRRQVRRPCATGWPRSLRVTPSQ